MQIDKTIFFDLDKTLFHSGVLLCSTQLFNAFLQAAYNNAVRVQFMTARCVDTWRTQMCTALAAESVYRNLMNKALNAVEVYDLTGNEIVENLTWRFFTTSDFEEYQDPTKFTRAENNILYFFRDQHARLLIELKEKSSDDAARIIDKFKIELTHAFECIKAAFTTPTSLQCTDYDATDPFTDPANLTTWLAHKDSKEATEWLIKLINSNTKKMDFIDVEAKADLRELQSSVGHPHLHPDLATQCKHHCPVYYTQADQDKPTYIAKLLKSAAYTASAMACLVDDRDYIIRATCRTPNVHGIVMPPLSRKNVAANDRIMAKAFLEALESLGVKTTLLDSWLPPKKITRRWSTRTTLPPLAKTLSASTGHKHHNPATKVCSAASILSRSLPPPTVVALKPRASNTLFATRHIRKLPPLSLPLPTSMPSEERTKVKKLL